MTGPHRAVRCIALTVAIVAGAAGCVLTPRTTVPDGASFLPEKLTPQSAASAVTAGKTKADVRAALGKGIEVRFDSGYEVWVYRQHDAARALRDQAEFVILFDPSGVVRKTRIKPATTSG